MASARSTVSIARTTPAQKPRGEHNITFNCGFLQGRGDIMSSPVRVQINGAWVLQPRDLVFCSCPCQDCARQMAKLNRNAVNKGPLESPEAPAPQAGRARGDRDFPEFIHISNISSA